MHHFRPALILAVALLLSGCARTSPSSEAQPPKEHTQPELTDQERFSQLIDDIFLETLTESGLTLHTLVSDPEAYGIMDFPATLGDYSIEGIKNSYSEADELYAELKDIDRDALLNARQLDYDILTAYLEAQQGGEDFYLYEYPFSSIGGLQIELPIVLAEYSFRTKEDVDNYLDLLSDIDECYTQLLAYVQAQEEAGIYLSDRTIDGIINSCNIYLETPENGMLHDTFLSRLDGLSDITEEERAAWTEKNDTLLKEDFTDAYTLLTEGLAAMKGHMELPVGLGSLPDGKKYYEYLLKNTTFTSYDSPRRVRSAIEQRMQSEMEEAYRLLSDNPELYTQMTDYSFTITDPAEALEDLQEKIKKDFPEVPRYPYEIRTIPESLEDFSNPAFYLTPPIDSQNENYIYINQASVGQQMDLYPVMAHEGYPGHLYQCNYFNAVNDSKLRSLLSFSCYVEGWATYVEYLSYQWDDQLSDTLARVLSANGTTSLALYALMDYEVNYEGMTIEELGRFLQESFGITDETTVERFYQTVCEDPANYMKYYMGYLEIMDMKEDAQDTLKDSFDLKEFHTFLLNFGPAPFSIIRDHLKIWIDEHRLPISSSQ